LKRQKEGEKENEIARQKDENGLDPAAVAVVAAGDGPHVYLSIYCIYIYTNTFLCLCTYVNIHKSFSLYVSHIYISS